MPQICGVAKKIENILNFGNIFMGNMIKPPELKIKHFKKSTLKNNRPDLGPNAFQLASHVVQGSWTFLDLSLIYCKCSSSVLSPMMSINLQRCTGNEWRLSANGNGVYSSVFF